MPTDLDVIRLENAACSVVVAPGLGGRVLSYSTLGREWLWRNPRLLAPELRLVAPLDSLPAPVSFDTWANWGGDKTWPAPQGWDGPDQWAGPPDPVLDGGPYRVVARGPRLAEVVSGVDPRTGLSIRRRIELDDSTNTLTVTSALTNESTTTRSWSAWEVTQLATGPELIAEGALVTVDTAESGTPVLPLLDAGPLDHDVQHGQVRVPLQERVGKLGFPGCSGSISLDLGARGRFTQTFDVHVGATYPDGGSRAELWMQYPAPEPLERFPDLHPDAHLVELECLSPLAQLAPGASVSLTVHWSATT